MSLVDIVDLLNISRLLVSFSDHVRNDNFMERYFINSLAEDISRPILAIIFDCQNLKNLNYVSDRNTKKVTFKPKIFE